MRQSSAALNSEFRQTMKNKILKKLFVPWWKMLIWISLPVIMFSCMNCRSMQSGTYVIKAGNHYCSGLNLPVIKFYWENPSVNFKYRIDDGAYAANNLNGVSKIYGFSEGQHHWNSSARLGFIVKDNVITVRAYCYVDGVSPQQNEIQKPEIGTIETNRWYSCRISRQDGYYVFNHEGKEIKIKAGDGHSCGYLLTPYVGGTFTLDKDIRIDIELLP
ncbi:MAG TPA: hypothetical protein DET40_07680 [Lentisphaeria bacterium]|nr:MAG: hypothetical protein A2X45_06615 [Lentisphaerae bacterium GWF2_50_93]HCE43413.1 hypothetical protein [Lentisphaeria bacterium]